MQELPHYTVRESSRAKRVRLQVSLRDGVVVVIPKGFNRNAIPAIVRKQQSWLEKVQTELLQKRDSLPLEDQVTVPKTVHLRITGDIWNVHYNSFPSEHVSICEQENQTLLISGETSCESACREVLLIWLKQKARELLIPRLFSLSSDLQIPVKHVRIKNQRTRWGSYSSKGSINLNLKLLFLPEHLVTYVLIHELCHAIHMDHSPRFWSQVERFDPEYRSHDREFRKASALIPPWVDN